MDSLHPNLEQQYRTLIQQSIDLLQCGIVQQHSFLPSQNTTTSLQKSQHTSENSLDGIARQIYLCQQCNLCTTRTQTVPGTGVHNPLLMIIGEAPGQQEDQQGLPFVGKSGQYLDKWLEAIHLSRHTNVFITNTVKCRPPNNRDPHDDEIQHCNTYLQQQIALCKPKMILALGRVAGRILIGDATSTLNEMRKKEYSYEGIPLRVTYHPSAVLRNQHGLRPLVWEDLQTIAQALNITTP